jgi:hypothetical protein
MALEPAGVSLQAEGFSDYIKKLDAIEKKNREVFDTEFKGTEKSFKQVTAAAKKYEKELKDLAAAEKKAADEAKKLAAAQKTAAATQAQAFISTGQAVLAMAKQIATAAFELGRLGAQFQGQQTGLKNLAGSFSQSGKAIQKSIQDASKGTLSGLDAIQAANQGLLLGVAKTPEEFAKLTNSALTLGRTLGLKSTQAIEQFTSALGRQSLLILDNFGISASQVNAEIERLAQADFGVARSELTKAQQQATFMKAALNIAGEAAKTIGDEAGNAQAAFDRLTASSENFKTELGIAISNLNQSLGITETITKEINQFTEAFKTLRGGAEGAALDEQIEATEIRIKNIQQTIEDTQASLERGGFLAFLDEAALKKQNQTLGELEAQLETLNLEKAAEDAKKFGDNLGDAEPVIKDNTEAIKAFESALKQAQSLQLSFARTAEDAALKQARAAEDLATKQARATADIERKQAQQIAKLGEKQRKDRDKLLDRQIKSRDKFEASALKQIQKAEESAAKERRKGSDNRLKAQKQLQDKLRQQEDRFRLSQLQGERRFQLADRRLRAEGDILGLQQLREDRELQRQEEKENFKLSQRETKKDGEDSLKEQDKNLRAQQDERKADINRLKDDLESQRSEQLANFDQQFTDLEKQQAEARTQLQIGFDEQAAQRAIALQREEEDRAKALQREEEDRRISQRRQLEDLGISLAEQKDVTAQGVNAIAEEIENVFGIDGVANNIITGFSKRTRSEFEDLFEDVEDIISEPVAPRMDTPLVSLTGDARRRTPIPVDVTSGVQRFQEGGVVAGPIGSPQRAIVHAGETVLPTHQQSFTMTAPVIPSQSLDVNMSGGFNVTGDGQSNDAILQAATEEMTENFRIAVRRLARRN